MKIKLKCRADTFDFKTFNIFEFQSVPIEAYLISRNVFIARHAFFRVRDCPMYDGFQSQEPFSKRKTKTLEATEKPHAGRSIFYG